MECLLIKATSIKPRIKGQTVKVNTYYPLVTMDSELKQLVSQSKKGIEVSLTVLDLTQGKQEISFPKLELGNSEHSLLYLLNEDIIQTEKEADFEEAEQLRKLSLSLAKQMDQEAEDITPYQEQADELNSRGLKKVSGMLSSLKKPSKKEKKSSIKEPAYSTDTDQTSSHSDNKKKQETVIEEERTLPQTTPVWEDELQEDDNQPIQNELPANNGTYQVDDYTNQNQPIQEETMSQSVETTLTFASFLQTKDENRYVPSVEMDLTEAVSNPVKKVSDALGINDINPTPLEEKQLAYIRKHVDRQLFQRLQVQFSDNLNQLSVALTSTLESLYLSSGLSDHDLNTFVTQEVTKKEKEWSIKNESKVNDLKTELKKEENQRIQALEVKHDSEIQELKARQSEEKQQVITDFRVYATDKLDQLKNTLSETIHTELNSYRSTLQSERQHDLSVQLLSEKERLLAKREEAILEEIDTVRKEQQRYIESLLEELVSKENEFLSLIEQEKMAKEKEAERLLKEKELHIKEEEVNILANENNQKSKQQTDQHELMMSLIQAQILKATQTDEPKTIEVTVPKEPTPPVEAQSTLRRLLYSVGVLSVLTVSFLGFKLYESTEDKKSIQSEIVKIQESTKDLTRSLEGISSENTQLKQQVVNSKETLANLLDEGKYDRAIELYGTELDKIENAMYEANDLKSLTAFNKSHDSQYGHLDEAILSGNEKKMIEEYKKLNTKTRLPGDRELRLPKEALKDD